MDLRLTFKSAFILWTLALAVMFWRARRITSLDGPSSRIANFSNMAVTLFLTFYPVGLGFLLSSGLDARWEDFWTAVVLMLSPFIIGSFAAYPYADSALILQAGLLAVGAALLLGGWAPSVILVLLFAFSALAESVAHFCLKKSADRNRAHQGRGYYVALASDRWTYLGVGIFLTEMLAWIVILTRLPLALAYPLTGLQKIFMLAFTVIVLRENVSRAEKFAFGLIGLGLAFVAYSGLGLG